MFLKARLFEVNWWRLKQILFSKQSGAWPPCNGIHNNSAHSLKPLGTWARNYTFKYFLLKWLRKVKSFHVLIKPKDTTLGSIHKALDWWCALLILFQMRRLDTGASPLFKHTKSRVIVTNVYFNNWLHLVWKRKWGIHFRSPQGNVDKVLRYFYFNVVHKGMVKKLLCFNQV